MKIPQRNVSKYKCAVLGSGIAGPVGGIIGTLVGSLLPTILSTQGRFINEFTEEVIETAASGIAQR